VLELSIATKKDPKMPVETSPAATSWVETAIEEACSRAEEWYRELPQFENRVNLGSVVGFRHP
jgi:hypothetical protein